MKSVTESAISDLVKTLAETSWSWTSDQIPATTARLGWQLVEIVDGKGAFATADWSLGDDDIQFALKDSQVNNITIPLTENISPNSADGQKFLLDAFARAVAAATAKLGRPTEQKPGSRPTARWRLPETTIIITHARVAVALTWANNTFQDYWDNLRDER